MLKREGLIEQGIGSTADVCEHFASLPENSGAVAQQLRMFGELTASLGRSPGLRDAWLAIVASVMNTEFLDTGRLWKVKTDGSFGYTYVSDITAREVFAAHL